MNRKRLFILSCILFIGSHIFGQAVSSDKSATNKFRASVVKIDITPDEPQMLAGYPERKSNGVHDQIFHRIIALDDGATQFFLVSTDNCKMSPAEYDKVAEMLQKQYGMISTTTEKVSLSTGILTIETPRKAMDWPEELSNYTRTTSTGVKMVRLRVRFLKINEDLAIWSAPLELFCEISNEVRDRSPFPYTFYYGYTCGNLGYMLTPEEWPKGGYEPTVSPFTPAAPVELKESVVNYLKGEMISHKTTGK